jgi:two-component system phosphate regulon response regulator PhoB
MTSARPLILIVEDEPAVAALLTFSLGCDGWDCHAVQTVAQGWDFIQARRPQLVVLDWMLRGQSGLNLLLRIRRERALDQLRVMMLTARTQEQDKLDGLTCGADDYVTKPFSPRELLARAKALVRATQAAREEPVIQVGKVVLDPASCTVRVDARRIAIGPAEYRLLQFLLGHPGEVFSRKQLLVHAFPAGAGFGQRTVDVHVLRLRKALGAARSIIKTVRGAGYLLSEA